MLRRLGWLIGLNNRGGQAKKLPDANPHLAKVQPVVMLDTVQEIAIYIHRFHNLDLFHQGWYQIKITVRWDNDEHASVGTPARVVQYEAPNLGSEDGYGVWRIDDTDNSFATQPFRIKFARQDVLLSVMVAFDPPLTGNEGPPSSAVILKFELLYAPVLENGSEFQASPDGCPAAVHEFRIPPKALLGLHSYCPVYFDAFHAVLVDVSVLISLLKAGSRKAPTKVPSIPYTTTNDVSVEIIDGSTQALDQVACTDPKQVMLVKALLDACDTLLLELQKLGNAISQAVDLTEFTSTMNDIKLFDSFLQANQVSADADVSGQGKPQNGLERVNGRLDFRSDRLLQNLSKDDAIKIFNLSGDQVIYLWNTFLNFHRDNKTQILEFLRDGWAKDQRAEWSMWMVYSKVEMPHHYINGGFDESSHHIVHKRGSSLWKLTDDPAQIAAMRAELHRRSISQMRITNRSIQDMQIFGDPSGIPIVIIERVMNAPCRTFSDNSYVRNLDIMCSATSLNVLSSEAGKKLSSTSAAQNGRDLKIVVFVHGFQGHHLDLRLVRNQWLLMDSKIQFLMSEVNEEKTSGDFREMGLRLAHEVISFVKRKMDKASRSGRLRDIKLSFVGHSIGNIIIRTAIAESVMEPYLRFLHTYVSLSGPHLGYLYSSNSLFNSGLWLLKKFKGTQCIHQLTFTDDPDIRNTFFYKLCKQKTLENFKHIILLSSPQDGYVPYHSARIESCRAASMDYSKKGKAFLEMLNDCLDQIRAPTTEHRVFIRCDVNFNTSSYGKNLNTFIGRAAHIEFLESDIFASVYWKNGSSALLSSLDPKKPLVDQLGNAFSITESPIWMDCSTTAQCREIEKAVGGALELSKITGSPAHERYTGPQIRKIFETQPEVYKNTERISLVSSFMACLFIGAYACIDETDGAGMNLMDIKQRAWSKVALEATAPGLEEKLGKLASAHALTGSISSYFVERFNFNENCLVVQWPGDNPNGLAGLTLNTPGDLAISLGTSDTVFGITKDPQPSLEGHVFPNPVDTEGYMVMLVYKNGSLTLEDVRNRYAEKSWDVFNKFLEQTPPLNGGKISFYYKEDEILPPLPVGFHHYLIENFTGETLDGLNEQEVLEFDPPSEVRALIEGQFLSMRAHAERFGMPSPKQIIATGGASANQSILSSVAFIFGCDIYTVQRPDSASLGAALRAAHGCLCSKKGSFMSISSMYKDLDKTSLSCKLSMVAGDQNLVSKYALLMKKRFEIENRLVQKLGRC